MPQPHIRMRALDQPRDVRHRHPPEPRQLHHPDVRRQRRERIRRHLRMRRRHLPQQRRFPRVRIPHQPRIRDLPQLQVKVTLLPRRPLRVARRRLIRRTLEMHIPDPALPPRAQHELLPHLRQVRDHLQLIGIDRRLLVALRLLRTLRRLGKIHIHRPRPVLHLHVAFLRRILIRQPIDNRPRRHRHDAILRALAKTLPSPAPVAIARLHDRLIKKRRQIILMRIRPQNHRAPAPAIPAIRPALRHKRFAPERDRAIPAVAGLGKNSDVIDKHGAFRKGRRPSPTSPKTQPAAPGHCPSSCRSSITDSGWFMD